MITYHCQAIRIFNDNKIKWAKWAKWQKYNEQNLQNYWTKPDKSMQKLTKNLLIQYINKNCIINCIICLN